MNQLGDSNQEPGLRQRIREQTAGYLMAGLGFVAGLAWNDAVKGLLDQLFPLGRDTTLARFIYAIVVTVIVVVIGAYLVRPRRQS
jgi:hypothetical protein